MPLKSTLSGDEKAKVKNVISAPTNKITYAALARVYYMHPQPSKWVYAGIQGALVFCTNNTTGSMHLKMVDLDGTRGVIWEQELYDGFELNEDGAIFLFFESEKCKVGFAFADEAEGKTFNKKIKSRMDPKSSKPKSEKKSKTSKSGNIDKSMISVPNSGSFVHVAHMGYDAESGFTSKGVDPSWTALLGNLETLVPKEVIVREMEYIKKFVRDYSAQQQAQQPTPKKSNPPPPALRRHVADRSGSSHAQSWGPQAPPAPPRPLSTASGPSKPAALNREPRSAGMGVKKERGRE